MGKTSIEWTDASWNPIVGCTEISPGCANCYAARLAATRLRTTPQYKGLADSFAGEINASPRWTGEVRFLPERLEEPLHWRQPRRIFVCDMSDLFHEKVHADWVRQIWNVMAQCPQHTFQILTKRASRMEGWIGDRFEATGPRKDLRPLPNVWLGVSVENQHFADERIPLLLETPAAVRWISAEPLLGSVDFSKWFCCDKNNVGGHLHLPSLDWVVCGGESGPNARPMHPDWARSLRDQCHAAGVPFFFKQWGEFNYYDASSEMFKKQFAIDLGPGVSDRTRLLAVRVGKKNSGRVLDGHQWNEFPAVKR